MCVWWSLLVQNRFLPQQNGEWTLTAIETFFTKTFSWHFLFLLDIINQFISWIVEIKFGSPEGSLLLWSLFAQWNSQCCKYYKRQESHVWFITGEHSKNAVLRGFHWGFVLPFHTCYWLLKIDFYHSWMAHIDRYRSFCLQTLFMAFSIFHFLLKDK